MDEAERWFRAATRCYRRTSPFPLAMLELQHGRLWIQHDDLHRARAWCARRSAGSRHTSPRRAT